MTENTQPNFKSQIFSSRNHRNSAYHDNAKKDEILKQRFGECYNNFYFYEEIFGNNQIVFLDVSDEAKKHFIVTDDVFEVLQSCPDLSKVYAHYCTYLKNFKRYDTIDKILAFVVDLDNVDSNDLFLIVHSRLERILKPTFIVNSGFGLHLIYQLQEPFTLLHRFRVAVNQLKVRLENQLKPRANNRYKIDHHSLAQAFRLPGFMNKLGRWVKCWKIGPGYNIHTLAEKFHIELVPMKAKKSKKKKKRKDITYIPNAHPKLYSWALELLYGSRPGWRYTSMLATVVCGWKARIPKEQIKKDLEQYVERYNEIWPENPIKWSEIGKALKAYGKKESTVCSKKQLAEWFNTEIEGTKRNGRTREEHLQIARAIRNAKISTSTKLKVEVYLKANPNASISEISRISGLSRTTIYKYGRELGLL
jgi:hypothetical protein